MSRREMDCDVSILLDDVESLQNELDHAEATIDQLRDENAELGDLLEDKRAMLRNMIREIEEVLEEYDRDDYPCGLYDDVECLFQLYA